MIASERQREEWARAHLQAHTHKMAKHIYGIDVKSLIPVFNVEIFVPSKFEIRLAALNLFIHLSFHIIIMDYDAIRYLTANLLYLLKT